MRVGLIERAMGDEAAEAKPAAAANSAAVGAREFDLDFDRLKAKGVFTPQANQSSQASELRAIRRRLLRRLGFLQKAGREAAQFRVAGKPRNIILVTSTRPGEGKTFAAVNLALSLAAEDGRRVLLIDGDAARPTVRSYFGIDSGPGLVDRLADPRLPAKDYTWKARSLALEIIGEGRATSDVTRIFAGQDAQRFFTDLSTRYPERLIIIDAPPLLATTETIALARYADEVVFVVEADSTPQQAVAAALDELLELNPNVSLLLNRCLIPAGGAYYGAYEHYERGAAAGAPTGKE